MQPAFRHDRLAIYSDIMLRHATRMAESLADGEIRHIGAEMGTLTLANRGQITVWGGSPSGKLMNSRKFLSDGAAFTLQADGLSLAANVPSACTHFCGLRRRAAYARCVASRDSLWLA
jgi:hypothetical protein